MTAERNYRLLGRATWVDVTQVLRGTAPDTIG